MNLAIGKLRHTPSNPFNVIILFLIIFNSGGVDIVSHFYITIATLLLLVTKLVVESRFSITAFRVSFVVLFIALVFNFAVTNSRSGIIEYLVYLSYVFTASWVVSVYRSSS